MDSCGLCGETSSDLWALEDLTGEYDWGCTGCVHSYIENLHEWAISDPDVFADESGEPTHTVDDCRASWVVERKDGRAFHITCSSLEPVEISELEEGRACVCDSWSLTWYGHDGTCNWGKA